MYKLLVGLFLEITFLCGLLHITGGLPEHLVVFLIAYCYYVIIIVIIQYSRKLLSISQSINQVLFNV